MKVIQTNSQKLIEYTTIDFLLPITFYRLNVTSFFIHILLNCEYANLVQITLQNKTKSAYI